jgi:hypothetical protein
LLLSGEAAEYAVGIETVADGDHAVAGRPGERPGSFSAFSGSRTIAGEAMVVYVERRTS